PLAETRGISEIWRCEPPAVMAVHPGLKPLQLGLVEPQPRPERPHFLGRQVETQPQTCWPPPPSHALIEILKDHPRDKTIVQQTSNDLRCGPLAALHWSQEHIALRGPEQLAVKEIAPDRVAQTQVVLRHLEDTQGREVVAQR